MPTYSGVLSNRSQYSLRYVVTQGTQDIANNRTLMSWSARVDETTEWGSWSNQAAGWWAYIRNGNVGSGSFTYNFNNYNTVALGSGSVWVPHNADGTMSIWVEAGISGNTVIGNAYTSATLGITTIPRASTSSWASSGTKYIGSTYTLNTNRASGSFTHTLTYTFGNKSGTIGTGVGASIAWAIPSNLTEAIPNTTYGTGTITTKTYSGSTLIGTTTSTFGVTVPESVVPSFTTITHQEATAGVAANIGAYVQQVSKLALAITGAAGVQGSTINGYKIEVAGQTINAVSGTTNPINASGNVTITGTVTDTRGRSASKSITVNVLAYSPPIISGPSVQRSLASGTPNEEGTYLRVNINASVKSLIVGSTQKNALRYRVLVRLKGTSNYTVKSDTQLTSITFNNYVNIGTYSITDSYDVRIEIIDKFTTSSLLIVVPVAKIFMHWDSSNGVGIGKYREQGALDVAGDIYATGNIFQRNKRVLTLQNTLYYYFTLTGVSTLFNRASIPELHEGGAIRVRLQAGGGGGGGSAATPTGGTNSLGTGGGGGGYAESWIPYASIPSSPFFITVGGGGTGGTGEDGSPGENSIFGTLVQAEGGGKGILKPANTYTSYVPGGTGGKGLAGNLLIDGGGGSSGSGGGSLASGGAGGSSYMGGGASSVGTGAGNSGLAGLNGGRYGGGGGGAMSNSGSTAYKGGNGAPGIVIVEIYS